MSDAVTAEYRGYVLRFTDEGVDVLDQQGRVLGRFKSPGNARAYIAALRRESAHRLENHV